MSPSNNVPGIYRFDEVCSESHGSTTNEYHDEASFHRPMSKQDRRSESSDEAMPRYNQKHDITNERSRSGSRTQPTALYRLGSSRRFTSRAFWRQPARGLLGCWQECNPIHKTTEHLLPSSPHAFSSRLHATLQLQQAQLGLDVWIEDLKVTVTIPTSMSRFSWYSYCIMVDVLFNHTNLTFVTSNKIVEKTIAVGNVQLGGEGGRLVIGEELDSEDDSFNIYQKFIGDMTDLAIVFGLIKYSDAASYVDNNSSQITRKYSAAYDFERNFHKFAVVGDVSSSNVSRSRIFSSFQEFNLLLPQLSTFEEGQEFCLKMKGKMYLPQSELKNKFALEDVKFFRDTCLGSHSSTLWLGAVADFKLNKWVSVEDRSELKYSNYHHEWSKMRLQHECSSVGVPTYEYQWVGSPCSARACVMCSFKKRPLIHIYGLCSDTLIETELVLDTIVNSKWSYSAEQKSRLTWREHEGQFCWVIENKLENVSLISTEGRLLNVPLGRFWFRVKNDLCRVKLLITKCEEKNEWTCDNGDCIPTAMRCNVVADCPDFSDEMKCEDIKKVKTYDRQRPPKMKKGKFLLAVTLNATVISEVSLSAFRIDLDITEVIQWKDNRLLYRFPNQNETADVRKFQNIWTPTFLVTDALTSPAEVQAGLETLRISRAHDAPAVMDGSIQREGSLLNVPLGRLWFRVKNDLCRVSEVKLLITKCEEKNEWTCDNGDCIPTAMRCNVVADCPDFSDEMECEDIKKVKTYDRQRPPKMKKGKFLLAVTLNATVISEVSLSAFRIDLDITEVIQWKDNRLLYRFPNQNETADVKKFQNIWTPMFLVTDALTSPAEVQAGLETLRISRAHDAPAVMDGSIQRDPLYGGENVVLTLTKKVSIRFHCQFALGFYPFDVQCCTFLYSLLGKDVKTKIHMGSLEPNNKHSNEKSDSSPVVYSGITKLLEYEVLGLNYTLSPDNYSKSPSIQVTVRLRNQYLYYLGNTFAPSMLLTLVCYYVFFFDIDDFQVRLLEIFSVTKTCAFCDGFL
ncbi:C-type lectin-like [Trinorchestia longiramus]|nr:C-type lectin-like [Trinorchestia longiramus]